ncbi:elongation of very long chain fatty acids protein 7-like [Pieris brassicae]|uniref:elongation of very long chain fatty acids protein 7-like n=1 Tax=Pieris brassicae TaxID=7116 RepID=UPI001E6603B0|nr:elongation of very long chain fatty acids protein 7-like [Pieris brassicae]XP_045521706.1 elongation of very long chain fatty acids protein 7-like [Pieris brassicae]XP_045521707.1 elongation of very long chain fatty acids protein 7-like [Pieris brassicae]XP_045521709.1 elongation of very long chain fatty acids protein 7-like [Pieris brassicae]XP_045521710.1 elongation of very long chain fatty acids protein 7-like [Pieris brassicae]XP_045521711.1 elongation of very long chain fatty acids pro
MTGFVKIAIDDIYSDNNWTTIINKYWLLAERVSDPRVQGWFLFDSPIPTLVMVLLYLGFVLVFGPMWMANRKPFKIKGILVTYNAAQVLLSSYMFYEHLMSGWWADYSLTCQPVDYSNSETAKRMLHLCWVYYFSKISEFADTVFFVLRKKKSQITWLHIYHHSLTPFEAWMLVKFIAGGHGTFSNIVNNLVHVIMYAYYMLAAMGPQYEKYLWWKKYLTTMQLSQFFLVLFHSISALICDCGYPKIIASGLILHSSIFIVLFMNFYMHAYKPEKPKRRVDSCNNDIPSDHATTNGHVKSDVNGHEYNLNGSINGLALDLNSRTNGINGIVRHKTENVISKGGLESTCERNAIVNGEIKEKIL